MLVYFSAACVCVMSESRQYFLVKILFGRSRGESLQFSAAVVWLDTRDSHMGVTVEGKNKCAFSRLTRTGGVFVAHRRSARRGWWYLYIPIREVQLIQHS